MSTDKMHDNSRKLTEFECYQQYIAIKQHFNTDAYNYFKYANKTRSNPDTFKQRKDYRFFRGLAIQKDPVGLLIANFSRNRNSYIGDILSDEGKRIYGRWKGYIDSINYRFSEEIKQLDKNFNYNFLVTPGTHPYVIRLYLSEKISLETLVILVDLVRCYRNWNKQMDKDDVIWGDLSRKLVKYKPFLQYDRKKMKQILKEHISNIKT